MATFLVEIATVVLIGVGVMLLRGTRGRWRRWFRSGEAVVCTHADCQYHNEPQARYCARCGRELPADE